MTGVKDTEQICLDGLPELVRARFLDRLSEVAHACIVNEEIEPAENTHALVQHSLYLILVSNVAHRPCRLLVTSQTLDRCPQISLVTPANKNTCSPLDNRRRDRETDTLCSSRDNGDFLLE
jgi:hypothetical protein